MLSGALCSGAQRREKFCPRPGSGQSREVLGLLLLLVVCVS